jgi:predicted adenine nucleotide alpha hydrolase (AANH) superfamily ATPase
MDDLFLHACCGPCATVSVPAWRTEGVEPRLWFWNPNLQPAVEHERRRAGLEQYAAAEEVAVVGAIDAAPRAAWRHWAASLSVTPAEARCATCLRLRLGDAAAAAAANGASRFSTTLSVSPYQRHDLIRAAGTAAADEHGVDFVYLDLRGRFRDSYAESRRLGLYRQSYCGCAASKWEAWRQRRAPRVTG